MENMLKFYRALENFTRIVQDEENEIWLSLRQDQVLIFDNFRLLHGRSNVNGPRTLIQVYLSRDDYLSKLKVFNIN